MDEKHDYEVGYGRPPKASQFQKGESGNPRGRPKNDPKQVPEQHPSIAAVFRKVCNQKVKTNGQGGEQYMTKLEASVTQLMNKAASGDLRATRLWMQMAAKYPELIKTPPGPPTIVRHTFVSPKPQR